MRSGVLERDGEFTWSLVLRSRSLVRPWSLVVLGPWSLHLKCRLEPSNHPSDRIARFNQVISLVNGDVLAALRSGVARPHLTIGPCRDSQELHELLVPMSQKSLPNVRHHG